MWSTDGTPPSAKEASGLIDALVQPSLSLLTAMHAASSPPAGGPTLQGDLEKAALAVADPTKGLLQALVGARA